ncbi:hypothetical protein D3C86_1499590 [compost metagenome]
MGRVTALQHLLIKKGFAQYFVGAAVQRLQQPILAAGQATGLFAIKDLEAFIVETQAVHRRGRHCGCRSAVECHPPQNGFDAHPQLHHAEGLWQVIIGPQAKAADAIGLGTKGRHQQHRGGMALAQLGQYRQAVHARQQDIHQHHVERLPASNVQAFLAVLAPGHLEAAAVQMLMNVGSEHKVVFDGQDSGKAGSDGSHDYLQIILS